MAVVLSIILWTAWLSAIIFMKIQLTRTLSILRTSVQLCRIDKVEQIRNGSSEVQLHIFQRVVLRLYRTLGLESAFDAHKYDSDKSGAVGWWEFVEVWRVSAITVQPTPAAQAILTVRKAGDAVYHRVWCHKTCFIHFEEHSRCLRSFKSGVGTAVDTV